MNKTPLSLDEILGLTVEWTEKSIHAGALPKAYALADTAPFLDQTGGVAVAQNEFSKNDWLSPEVVVVPTNLNLSSWSAVFAEIAKMRSDIDLPSCSANSLLSSTDEVVMSHGIMSGEPGWKVAIVSSTETPIPYSKATDKEVEKQYRPKLETYLALQLQNIIKGEDFVDLSLDMASDPKRDSFGLATLLQERVLVGQEEGTKSNYMVAGARSTYRQGIWVGRIASDSVVQPAGLRPTINDVMIFEPEES